MNKKNFILIAIALALAGVYIVCFTGLFRPKIIQITKANRPVRTSQAGATTVQVFFALDNDYSLTDVKVVPVAALQTNKLAQPVWHLVSDSGSDDVSMFAYGERVSGMDPVASVEADPLQPGVMYRLFVAAGRAKGQLDFQLGVPAFIPSTNSPKPVNPDD
jgi:FlaG/FlaF family flagellin (archaellin)